MVARCGGVPGGVVDGELLLVCCKLCRGGIHLKHTLLGLGAKLIPPQELHGGVGGGVHGVPIIGGGGSRSEDVSVNPKEGGREDGFSSKFLSSADKLHLHELQPHSGHPIEKPLFLQV